MDASEAVIGVAGLLSTLAATVAGLYYTNRARTAPYREQLYAKQLEAYENLFPILADYTFAATAIIGPKPGSVEEATKARILTETRVHDVRLHAMYRKWAMVLPMTVNERVVAVMNMRNGLMREDILGPEQHALIAQSAGPGAALAKSYQRVIVAARESLGVEALSSETQRLIDSNNAFEIAEASRLQILTRD